MGEKWYSVNATTLTWTSFAQANGVADDDATIFEIDQAKSIAVQMDTLTQTSPSTSTDFNILVSNDGTVFDNVNYAEELALGADKVKTILVTPGPKQMKILADNNDGANNSAPLVKVIVRS